MPSVTFAYNTTTSIPAAGAQRVAYTVVYARDDEVQPVAIDHELVNNDRKRDIIGTRLVLRVKLGAGILSTSAGRTFFRAFFTAKHKWAVYGNFKDTANSANSNLCKCDLDGEESIDLTLERDLSDGWRLSSEKVF